MATRKWSTRHERVSPTGVKGKKTSQGRGNVSTSTMNKNKKANRKLKYRGQGK
jgi:hypothetical protein